jgi:hypothetical protein
VLSKLRHHLVERQARETDTFPSLSSERPPRRPALPVLRVGPARILPPAVDVKPSYRAITTFASLRAPFSISSSLVQPFSGLFPVSDPLSVSKVLYYNTS